MKTLSIILAGLLASGITLANTGFAPEEDISYSVSEELPLFAPEEDTTYSVSTDYQITHKELGPQIQRFAQEEDITYSVSTDNIASAENCVYKQ